MKILFCHNFYSQRGGEDAVAQKELEMLRQAGHTVIPFLRDKIIDFLYIFAAKLEI